MTTKVQGKHFGPGNRLTEIDAELDYRKGADESFSSFTLDPNRRDGVQVTDRPEGALIYYLKDGIEVSIDGQPTAMQDRYTLTEGSVLVVRGAEIEGKRAELEITFTRPNPERLG